MGTSSRTTMTNPPTVRPNWTSSRSLPSRTTTIHRISPSRLFPTFLTCPRPTTTMIFPLGPSIPSQHYLNRRRRMTLPWIRLIRS
jgi:hypothetical protein